jgi:AcrR family transcriptional regulator
MRRTKADAEKTKEAIIDAAVDVFAGRGYEHARLDQVARKAGVTKGAIYWHFKDKQDLYEHISRREQERMSALIDGVLKREETPFRKVRALVYSILDNFFDNPKFRSFIELTWYKSGTAMFNEQLREKTNFVQGFIRTLEGLLDKAAQSAEIGDGIDCRRSALHIASLINGTYRLYVVAPDRAREKCDAIEVFNEYFEFLAKK